MIGVMLCPWSYKVRSGALADALVIPGEFHQRKVQPSPSGSTGHLESATIHNVC